MKESKWNDREQYLCETHAIIDDSVVRRRKMAQKEKEVEAGADEVYGRTRRERQKWAEQVASEADVSKQHEMIRKIKGDRWFMLNYELVERALGRGEPPQDIHTPYVRVKVEGEPDEGVEDTETKITRWNLRRAEEIGRHELENPVAKFCTCDVRGTCALCEEKHGGERRWVVWGEQRREGS